jgi:hypothetical protein
MRSLARSRVQMKRKLRLFWIRWKRFCRNKRVQSGVRKVQRLLLIPAILIVMTLLILPSPSPEFPNVGEHSRVEIRAPWDFYYKDEIERRRRQRIAAEKVRPIYTIDKQLIPIQNEKISNFFSEIRSIKERKENEERRKELFEKVSPTHTHTLLNCTDPELTSIEKDVRKIVEEVLNSGVIKDYEKFKKDISKGITLHIVTHEVEEKKMVDEIWDVYPIEDLTLSQIELNSSPRMREIACEIAKLFLIPNLKFNSKEYETARKKAKEEVEPVIRLVRRGERIVGQGELVTEKKKMKLDALSAAMAKSTLRRNIGFFLLTGCFMSLVGMYLHKYQPKISQNTATLLLLGLIIIITISIARAISLTPFLPNYLIPTAFASMLLVILFNEKLSIFTTFFLSVLIGILVGNKLEFMILFLVGGLVAIYTTTYVRVRADLVKAGFAVSAANSVVIIAYGLLRQDSFSDVGVHVLWGVTNGVIAAILTIGLLPFFESIFRVTTNFKLLELADLNTPLMKKLLAEAPGTHHHSLIVGKLAETATESIGANSLLTRVGAYYHDIGKMNKPEYFVENQKEGSKHSNLKPTLSASILKSHIKDGVELIKKDRLPKAIMDIIREHHGTTLMSYFYHQAQEEEKEHKFDPSDFRYPGPIPQTKEAAIIMLADSVEAATRTLVKPTPARIEESVKNVINNKFIDHQLDDCDLTLRDLTKIADSFVRILTGIFHSRVEYPEERSDGGFSIKSSLQKNKGKFDQKNSERNLKS